LLGHSSAPVPGPVTDPRYLSQTAQEVCHCLVPQAGSLWYFSPPAVVPERQGQGIGGRVPWHFCENVDRPGAATYLATDRPENVLI